MIVQAGWIGAVAVAVGVDLRTAIVEECVVAGQGMLGEIVKTFKYSTR